MPISGQGLPAIAASRSALTPQVGASAHEIGPTQPGSSDSDTSSPVTSQTGYSSRFERALALRYKTNVEARIRPRSPRPTTVTGNATTNATGWATSSGTSKKSRPQTSVAVSE